MTEIQKLKKRQRARWIAIVLSVLFLVSSLLNVAVEAAEVTAPPVTATQEIHVYINADNDIIGIDDAGEPFHHGTRFYETLRSLELPPHVGLHIYHDPQSEWGSDRISSRFTRCGTAAGKRVDLGETDSADPAHLSTLLQERCFPDQPTEKVLIIWGHGKGFHSIAPFDYSEPEGKPTSWVDLLKNAGASGLDLVIFDSCLMGTVEVMESLSDRAKEVISSPVELPSEGIRYGSWPTLLNTPAAGWYPQLKQETHTYYGERDSFTPLISVSLSEWASFRNVLNASLKYLETQPALRKEVQRRVNPKLRGSVDNLHLLTVLKGALHPESAETAARLEAAQKTILRDGFGSLHFFYPEHLNFFSDADRADLGHHATSEWAARLDHWSNVSHLLSPNEVSPHE